MFSIQIQMDSQAAQDRLDAMMENIKGTAEVQLPIHFVEWQEQDMKRDHPNIEISGWSVMTSIWPTSRKKMVPRKRRRFGTITRQVRGLRRILRPEMFEALRFRMEGMMAMFVNWRTTR